jgi:hypothetical protein
VNMEISAALHNRVAARVRRRAAGVDMSSLRTSLKHPFGMTVIVVSVVLSALLLTVPGLERWSPRASWVLMLGLATYVAIVFATAHTQPSVSAPELRTMHSVRKAFAARHAELSASSAGGQAELTSVLDAAVRQLDEVVVPALSKVIVRNQRLARHLRRYEEGDLPAPDPEVLARLERIQTRQREVIAECVRQASNADAALVALLQEHDDRTMAASAAAWAADLLGLHDALSEVLSDVAHTEDVASITDAAEATGPALAPTRDEEAVAKREPEEPGAPRWDDPTVLLVEEALRKLNNPAQLSACGLLRSTPRMINGVTAAGSEGTPLEQAQWLRNALVAAIERLRPATEGAEIAAPQMLQYHILRDEYVFDRPNSHIMMRLNISESTFHRQRRTAILALASELRHEEQQRNMQLDDGPPAETLLQFAARSGNTAHSLGQFTD